MTFEFLKDQFTGVACLCLNETEINAVTLTGRACRNICDGYIPCGDVNDEYSVYKLDRKNTNGTWTLPCLLNHTTSHPTAHLSKTLTIVFRMTQVEQKVQKAKNTVLCLNLKLIVLLFVFIIVFFSIFSISNLRTNRGRQLLFDEYNL